jgi:flagellar motor switch/type III secretory pathway protein FliN
MSLDLSCADAESVKALNHLMGPARVSTLKVAEKEFSWNWRRGDEQLLVWGAGIKLEAAGVSLQFWSEYETSSELLASINPNLFHDEARLLARAKRYASLIAHFSAISGCDWIPVELLNDEPPHAFVSPFGCAGFKVLDEHNDSAFEGWIGFDPSAASILNRVHGRCSPRESVIANVPSRFRIHLLSRSVTKEQLQGLVPQSAVVLGNHRSGKILVRVTSICGRYEIAGRLEGEKVTVEGSLKRVARATFANTQGATMQSSQEPDLDTSAASQTVDVGDLPIELSFEVGALNISMSELESSLQSGYTFNLDRELRDDCVLVRANGVVIANGELLKVGDMLAVRITEIVSHGRR